jgi:hypothetical protein
MLQLAGYGVASPKEPDDALILFSQETFDAVIIGESVEHDMRAALVTAIRNRRSETPIVFVHSGTEPAEEPLANMSVDVTAGPTPLVAALDKLLRNAA